MPVINATPLGDSSSVAAGLGGSTAAMAMQLALENVLTQQFYLFAQGQQEQQDFMLSMVVDQFWSDCAARSNCQSVGHDDAESMLGFAGGADLNTDTGDGPEQPGLDDGANDNYSFSESMGLSPFNMTAVL